MGDVLILGAGPAGCAAALAARSRGLSVTLINAAQRPSRRPGETLPPAIEPLLEQLGAGDLLAQLNPIRHASVHVRWGSNRTVQPLGGDDRGPWQGYQIPRDRFDEALLERASAQGCRILRPCRATRVLLDRDRVAGVETDRGALRARWIVDAAGSRHWLAAQLNLRQVRRSPRLIARYGYARGAPRDHIPTPSLTADGRGWTWLAHIADDRHAWVHLPFDGSLPSGRWRPPIVRHLEPEGPSRGADVSWRHVAACAGDGYFCVGDAASVLDPLSSHGVLRSVMSGMQTVHLIHAVERGAVSERRAGAHYRRWMSDWFEHDARHLRRFYAELESGPRWARAPQIARELASEPATDA